MRDDGMVSPAVALGLLHSVLHVETLYTLHFEMEREIRDDIR
jgi:hypothetical protein